MKKNNVRKVMVLLAVMFLVISLVSCQQPEAQETTSEEVATDEAAETTSSESGETAEVQYEYPVVFNEEIKVAVIRNEGMSDHCAQMFKGAVASGESLGFTVDTMITGGDDVKFQDMVQQSIDAGYDGLVLSHGKQEYSYDLVQTIIDAGIPVVTFDTVPLDADGNQPVGVTVTQQADADLARESLNALIQYCQENLGVEVPRIITTFYGPGVPPLDRRMETLNTEYIDTGKLELVDVVTISDMNNMIADMQTHFAAMLNKYPEGSFDAVWGMADIFTQGCYMGAEDVGRLGEFPFFAIDCSDTDLDYMRQEGSPWMTSTAVDAAMIGDVVVRILAVKMAGEETPDSYNFAPSTIWQDQLTPETNVTNLGEIVPSWGVCDDFQPEWMAALKEAVSAGE